jgi:hypothetical protein
VVVEEVEIGAVEVDVVERVLEIVLVELVVVNVDVTSGGPEELDNVRVVVEDFVDIIEDDVRLEDGCESVIVVVESCMIVLVEVIVTVDCCSVVAVAVDTDGTV